MQIVDSHGTIVATADKVHLVPFGEYLPFQATLESLGLEQLTRVPGGFSAGTRRRALAVPRRAAGAAADLLRGRSFPATADAATGRGRAGC